MSQISKQFGDFELMERVSHGQSGSTFRARNPAMDRTALVKTMPADAAKHEKLLKRFQREVRLAAQLTHPNLVTAFHAGCHDGTHYLVTEDVEGVNLATKVENDGPLNIEAVVDAICEAARGLGYMHDQGVFHRNVKPSNLLLDKHGNLKVTNLTAALIDDDSEIDKGDSDELTIQGQVLGTAEYMAPEQAIDAHAADARSDIYSLGCTMHYLLTGKPPYGGKGTTKKLLAHTQQPIPTISDQRDDVPKAIDEVFAQMVAKLPEDRYQEMSDVVDGLLRAFYGGGESVARQQRFPWELVLTGVFVGGGVATLVLTIFSSLGR